MNGKFLAFPKDDEIISPLKAGWAWILLRVVCKAQLYNAAQEQSYELGHQFKVKYKSQIKLKR
jgi:hypothetical protein